MIGISIDIEMLLHFHCDCILLSTDIGIDTQFEKITEIVLNVVEFLNIFNPYLIICDFL